MSWFSRKPLRKLDPAPTMAELLAKSLLTWTDQQVVEALTEFTMKPKRRLNWDGQAHVRVLEAELRRRGKDTQVADPTK